MKCEICGKNDATVFIKHVGSGAVKKLHACAECAEEKGLDVQLPIPLLVDFLFGPNGERQSPRATGGKTCPVCNMRRSHFRKTSLFGCPACYEAFPEEVAPFLEGLPDGGSHVGKVPAREMLMAEVAGLEKRLRNSVSAQNYEEAAQLRDRLRDAKLHVGKKGGNDG